MSTITIILGLAFIGLTYVIEGMTKRETQKMFDSLDNE